MAIKLIKRNKLRVPVKGTVPGEDGKPVKFDFTLLCKRLNQTEIDKVMEDKDGLTQDFLLEVAEGWEDVLLESGDPLEFSADNFMNEILEQPAMRTVCFGAYLKEIGAIAKN
jgi:hypothetical protein